MPSCSVVVIRSDEIGWVDLLAALDEIEGTCIIGEASTAERGLDLVATLRPDVVISAEVLHGEPLREPLLALRRTVCPAIKIVLLTSHLRQQDFATVDADSVDAHLLWTDLSSSALRQALQVVITRDVIVVSRGVVDGFFEAQRCNPRPEQRHVVLTERERAVLQGLAEGWTRREIAEREALSERTVERTVGDLEAKLEAATPFVLGLKAAHLGLVV